MKPLVTLFFLCLTLSCGGIKHAKTLSATPLLAVVPTTKPIREVAIFGIAFPDPLDVSTVFCGALNNHLLLVENPNLIYVWEFGDGNLVVTKSAQVKHQYLSIGVFDIKLTILDKGDHYNLVRKVKILDQRPRFVDRVYDYSNNRA